ncbi:MAG: alpha/beta hydrolase [Anaerolineaceae bacterium]|nr:alpha/beta hydrolase [Anaerolineaceae bacterium]
MKTYRSDTVQVNGIDIHYYRSTPPGGAPTLLLLHGLTDNGMCWVRVADALCESYDVVMPDTRGHGLSEKPAAGYSLEGRAADVAGLIDALSLDHPILFGHSLGGQAAMAIAALYPQKVGGVVLEDPAWFDAPGDEEAGEENAKRWLSDLLAQQSLDRAALIAECSQKNPAWHADEVSTWAESKYQMDGEALVQILTSMSGGWQQYVNKASCPILLVTAEPELGAIITPEMVEEASALWKQGQEAHIPGAGHCIHRDQFDLYMKEVKAFLSGLG